MTTLPRVLALVGLQFVFANTIAAPQALTAVEFVELPRLRSPSLSPDGQYLLHRRSTVIWADNKVVNRLQLIDLGSGAVTGVIEPESSDESFSAATWTGNSEGFITRLEREEDKYKQVYYYDLVSSSLRRLTDHDEDIDNVIWSANDDGFYFSADRPTSEAEKAAKESDWVIPEFDVNAMSEVWFFDWETETTTRLLGGDFHVRNYSLSPDGRSILFARTDHTLIDRPDSELWLYDLEKKNARRLTNNGYTESKATLSPDGGQVAFIATVNARGEQYYEDNIFLQTIDGEPPVMILPNLPMEMLDIEWDRTGDGLYVLGNTGLRTQLYYYAIHDQSITLVTGGDSSIGDWSFDPESNSHVYINTDASSPGEIWMLDATQQAPVQVSHVYDALSAEVRLPQQRAFEWRADDGTKLEGLLVYPVGYEQGESFPLATITHGGPRSSAQFGSWNMSRYVPVLAGQGYGVFLPNHRGGTGYGDAFMRDMVGGYFNNAHTDVLDGIDALVEQGLADADQLVKMGWSAGGHMTNKLITVTDRFKAASSGAGASDWVSMYAETDARFNRTYWFGGAPWEEDGPLESYSRQSTLKDSWRVKTPTLFFVGEDDERVPPTQSIMMYRGTKAAGVETRLYIAKGQPHNYSAPSFRLFKINTELDWYARHLGRAPYVSVFPEERLEISQ